MRAREGGGFPYHRHLSSVVGRAAWLLSSHSSHSASSILCEFGFVASGHRPLASFAFSHPSIAIHPVGTNRDRSSVARQSSPRDGLIHGDAEEENSVQKTSLKAGVPSQKGKVWSHRSTRAWIISSGHTFAAVGREGCRPKASILGEPGRHPVLSQQSDPLEPNAHCRTRIR